MAPPAAQALLTADGRVVATSVVPALTLWRRFTGLMLDRELPEGHGLALTPCASVHMFLMRFPIDVAFLDREGKVLRVYHGLRPGRVTRHVRGARTAVELPAGTLRRAGVEPGTVLALH